VLQLEQLLCEADRYIRNAPPAGDAAAAEQVEGLVHPGTSLGGARPKANYRAPDGSLWIAKFPSKTDRRDVGTWEHVYLSLARAAGVVVPDTEILSIGPGGRTFATRRFDRMAGGRRLYASALTLSARTSTEDADYADIARAITGNVTPAAVREDLAQMYRRLAFNVLAGNRDDHLRNHGFLRLTDGWRLAPAFDLNPAREMRQHATAVNGRTVAPTADDVLATRAHFGLTEHVARVIADCREMAGPGPVRDFLARSLDSQRMAERMLENALTLLRSHDPERTERLLGNYTEASK